MSALLGIFCFLMVFYAYFGYPLLLAVLVPFRKRVSTNDPAPESVSVIITVRNEENVIAEKLESTLALDFRGRSVAAAMQAGAPIEILVASDASDDATDSIVESFSSRGVRLIRLAERGGKEKAQAAAVAQASGEIVIFTDAKIRLSSNAVDLFLAAFSDVSVGAVSSVDQVEGTGSGEGFYVRYEMWIRSLESRFHSLVGLSGSCFAVRRSLCENLQTDVPSDFALLLEAQRRGLRGIHGAGITGSYAALQSARAEFSRKVRTVLRGITTLMARKEVLQFEQYGVFSWQIASHKLARWAVPWFFVFGTLLTTVAAAESETALLFAIGAWILFTLAAIGATLGDEWRELLPVKIALFFVVSNAAIGLAWIQYLRGQRAVFWTPSAKGSE